jgi:hypothetical protein
MNLLYMGLITERVAIIPQFTPMHLKDGAPYLAFGEVFDVPRLQKALRNPVLEWPQVKARLGIPLALCC